MIVQYTHMNVNSERREPSFRDQEGAALSLRLVLPPDPAGFFVFVSRVAPPC